MLALTLLPVTLLGVGLLLPVGIFWLGVRQSRLGYYNCCTCNQLLPTGASGSKRDRRPG